MSLHSYSNYSNNSPLKNNNTQSFISYEQDNSIFQFESMLNNISEWQNNPIEATRLCFKYLYEINRSTQKSLEIIDKSKATKIELSTGLNTKGDLSDIMQTFNEVAQNMEQRPTKEEMYLIIDNKLDKKINEEIKKIVTKGDIKINLKKNWDELNKNFVNIKDFGDLMNNNKINIDNINKTLKEKNNMFSEVENNKANKYYNDEDTHNDKKNKDKNKDNYMMNNDNKNNIDGQDEIMMNNDTSFLAIMHQKII